MNKVKFYLVQLEKETNQEEFGKAVSKIGEIPHVGTSVDKENDCIHIFYEKVPFRAVLKLIDDDYPKDIQDLKLPRKRIEVECDRTDHITVEMLKDVLYELQFRVFSPDLRCFIPEDAALINCLTYTAENHEKAVNVLSKFHLKPLFLIAGTYGYYAENIDNKTVHFVNDNLLYHLIILASEEVPETNEFSYKVAENAEDFVLRHDVGLIPKHFYDYFGKSQKIINYSGFNILNPGRKVFIKPYILEINNLKRGFFKVAWGESSLLHMDKIREGETLHQSILRIITKDLNIANDYIGATVARVVEYDLDKENILTPRLVVRIFLQEAHLTPEQAAKKDRTWISREQMKET